MGGALPGGANAFTSQASGAGGGSCIGIARTLVFGVEHDSSASVQSGPVNDWPLEWQIWQAIDTPTILRETGRSKAATTFSVDCASPANDFPVDFYSTLNINLRKLNRRGAELGIRCVANYPGFGDAIYGMGADNEWLFQIGEVTPSPMDWGGRVNGLADYLGIDERSGGNTYGSNGYATDAEVPEGASVDTITWEGEADATTTLDILVNNAVAQNIALTGAGGELPLAVTVTAGQTLAVRYAAGPTPVNMTVTLWLRKNQKKTLSLQALVAKYTSVPGATGAPTVRWEARRFSGDAGRIEITGVRHDLNQAQPLVTSESVTNCEEPVSCPVSTRLLIAYDVNPPTSWDWTVPDAPFVIGIGAPVSIIWEFSGPLPDIPGVVVSPPATGPVSWNPVSNQLSWTFNQPAGDTFPSVTSGACEYSFGDPTTTGVP